MADLSLVQDELLSVKELAEHFGVSVRTIRNWFAALDDEIEIAEVRITATGQREALYSLRGVKLLFHTLTAESKKSDQEAGKQLRIASSTEEGRATLVAMFNAKRLTSGDLTVEDYIRIADADPKALQLVDGLLEQKQALEEKLVAFEHDSKVLQIEVKAADETNAAMQATIEKMRTDVKTKRVRNIMANDELTLHDQLHYAWDRLNMYVTKYNSLRINLKNHHGFIDEDLDYMETVHIEHYALGRKDK
jgi:DNA-binding transcriptional MerR regulator